MFWNPFSYTLVIYDEALAAVTEHVPYVLVVEILIRPKPADNVPGIRNQQDLVLPHFVAVGMVILAPPDNPIAIPFLYVGVPFDNLIIGVRSK
jgi:hypothetical protein